MHYDDGLCIMISLFENIIRYHGERQVHFRQPAAAFRLIRYYYYMFTKLCFLLIS